MWHLPQNRPLPQGPEDATLLLLSLSCSWHVQLALSKDQPYFLVTHSWAREGSRGGGAGTAHSSPPVGQGSCGLTASSQGPGWRAGSAVAAFWEPLWDLTRQEPVVLTISLTRSQPLPRASRLQEAGGPPSRPRWALNAFNGQSELTAWAPTSRKMLVLGRTYPTSPLT